MIGRIEKVPLREVWKKEAKDFTTWLYDNIEVLAEEIDIDLTAIEKEKSVGVFFADIVAEDGAGEKVIIENQLEKTNHAHLGQILTYISNLEAKIAIWISSKPCPEHERAIEWLNEAGVDVDFYLIQIEAYRIGNSEPAPKFTIVTGPSEKDKAVGQEKKELAERHKKRLEFWQELLEKSKSRTALHSNISPCIYSWIGAGSGKRGITYNYVITKNHGQIEVYIDRGKGSDEENKMIFDKLFSHKEDIENIFGESLEWQKLEDRRASRIKKVYTYAGISDRDKWGRLQDNMISGMIKLEEALKAHINSLNI